eukprot:PhF_6_TR8699/c0_g1_i1/m.13632
MMADTYIKNHQLKQIFESLSQRLMLERPPNPKLYTLQFLKNSVEAWDLYYSLKGSPLAKQHEILTSPATLPNVERRLKCAESLTAKMGVFRDMYFICGWEPDMSSLVGISNAAAAAWVVKELTLSVKVALDIVSGVESDATSAILENPRLGMSPYHFVLAAKYERISVVQQMMKSNADPHRVDPITDSTPWETNAAFLKSKCSVPQPPKRELFQKLVYRMATDGTKLALVDTVTLDVENMELSCDFQTENPHFKHTFGVMGIIVKEIVELYRGYPKLRCRGTPGVGSYVMTYDRDGKVLSTHPLNPTLQKDFGVELRRIVGAAKERMDRMKSAALPVF